MLAERGPTFPALLRLREEVKYTDYIQPICLPDTPPLDTETFLGIKCVATGWGMRTHGGHLETRLKEVLVPVVNNSHCAKMYGMMHNIPVHGYHLCAGQVEGHGLGTCVVSTGELCVWCVGCGGMMGMVVRLCESRDGEGEKKVEMLKG